MKLTLFAILSVATSVFGQQGGTGPYKAWYKTDPGLPNHTIYLPVPDQHPASMPVLLWGNGACSANGLDFQKFLTNVASQGVIVIANGRPGGQGSSNNQWMHDALRWVRQNAGKTWPYERVDASRVAAAGMSCGGVEAYEMRNSGVVGIGIFNSGLLDGNNRARIMSEVKAPIFYFMGGPSDIAYQNAEQDYRLVPGNVASWKGNLNVGHGGTYQDNEGGKFGWAAVNWVKWVLRQDVSGRAFFTEGGAQRDGWQVESKRLDLIR
ncbi:hypothetical protein BJ508DRAFT_319099 [Ascobolus immersus RN42]|uniref:Alpha/beta-hydrolase n=1 Tax=Ascobolus immersus RN42 TaxID=1160509 RepID=A0A3N4HZK7_ASCIM|nr:hypothetical protein BJ508DRAFT_319099 [Ascobolus immersus RN42]